MRGSRITETRAEERASTSWKAPEEEAIPTTSTSRPSAPEETSQILADCDDLAEISRLNQAAVTRRVVAARQLAQEQLRERYGDGPVSERIYRAYGLGRTRSDGGRRARALRERVLAVATELTRAGIPFGCDSIGEAIGDVGPGGVRRIRHAVSQLMRAGRWPSAEAARRRQNGGEGA